MAFNKKEVEDLLAATGRRCCLCSKLHRVQVHHIVPQDQGGSDDIDNGIPLCPNCHDEVHIGYSPGRTTRVYSAEELRRHRDNTIERVKRQHHWAPGTPEYEQDKALVLFYAQCLDRPAFRTHFHSELSFSDFDRAIEDTLLALNTGYWRTRDGVAIDRSQGKAHLLNQDWRDKLDAIAGILEEIRARFRQSLGLDEMLFRWHHPPSLRMDRMLENRYLWHYPPSLRMDRMLEDRFRGDFELGQWMDQKRREAIELMNSIIREIGHPGLQALR